VRITDKITIIALQSNCPDFAEHVLLNVVYTSYNQQVIVLEVKKMKSKGSFKIFSLDLTRKRSL